MTEPTTKSIVPYDLVAPDRSLLQALNEPRPCLVCGKTRTPIPLRSIWAARRHRDGHEACDRTVADWDRQVAAIDQDPEYQRADAAVAEAQAHRDQVWADRLAALGLPDWYVRGATARYETRNEP